MTDPLISIALCTYNSGHYLPLLMDSLLAQSYKNIEIICCDDKSTDGTQDVLLAYQHSYPQLIRLSFNDINIGYSKNFEQAVALCNGDFIAIADHDDIWLETKLEKLRNNIGDAMLIYCDSIYIDKDGKETGRSLTTKFNLHDRPDPRSFIFASAVWGHTVLFRKELLKTAFPIPDNAPYDTWLAYVASSSSFVQYLPEPLTYWRQHASSFSATYYEDKDQQVNLKYYDWKELMSWIGIMKDYSPNEHSTFFERLYALYKRKENSQFVWPLYFFLVKHRRFLFKVWKRSYISSLNECRKMSIGVRK